MPIPGLNVHDITVKDATTFSPNGSSAEQRIVSYFVGTHGPFTLTYAKADATPDRIKQDIRTHVADLQSLDDLTA
jgi:hypothetical protein